MFFFFFFFISLPFSLFLSWRSLFLSLKLSFYQFISCSFYQSISFMWRESTKEIRHCWRKIGATFRKKNTFFFVFRLMFLSLSLVTSYFFLCFYASFFFLCLFLSVYLSPIRRGKAAKRSDTFARRTTQLSGKYFLLSLISGFFFSFFHPDAHFLSLTFTKFAYL